ncbi:DcaP family trimeric outer membrane transporter [Sphingomonas sp. dw_22]|uniref:DcaP family trimeric outer membrane transporter n=1 Tax=Sphingomonas sp. dw_22 TaxID=2721175 RepID=UPI002116AC54|nr:DcaP family trimeric outer membrane transporter [Sphingomonas sp. dw_22]
MSKQPFRATLMVGAGALGLGLMAQPAAAQQAGNQAKLEARLAQLEAEVAELRGELQASRAGQAAVANQAATASAAAAKASEQIAAIEKRPAAPAEGFNVGGTNFRFGGFIKAVASFSRYDDGDVPTGSLGKDFYLPQQIPVGGARESNDFTGHAKQTRLQMTTSTPIGGHQLKGLVEVDFQTAAGTQGSQRTTNGYDLALRRGFFTYDHFLAGQEWSNFQYVAALPESTDFVGATEGTVFVREMQLRYAFPLSKQATLSVAIENPETASITTTSATLIENDDDRVPDVTARLNYAASFGELSLAGLVRQLSVDNGAVHGRAAGWGVSAAGKIPFGPDKRHDLRFMATYGDGIGRYVGLNLAPDAVFDGTPGSDLETVKNFAGFAAVKIGWTPTIRSSLIGSYQHAVYPDAVLIPGAANRTAWSVAGNLFWSPVKGFDLGVELRHGEREIVSGEKGQLDRLEFATKYSF